MNRTLRLLLALALAPSIAHSNVSHVSGSSAVGLVVLVAIAFFGILFAPPLLAALTADRGGRKRTYFVAWLVWCGLAIIAFRFPGKYGNVSDSEFLTRLAVFAIGYMVAILLFRLRSRLSGIVERFRRPKDDREA